jgi:hypothetical protein
MKMRFRRNFGQSVGLRKTATEQENIGDARRSVVVRNFVCAKQKGGVGARGRRKNEGREAGRGMPTEDQVVLDKERGRRNVVAVHV